MGATNKRRTLNLEPDLNVGTGIGGNDIGALMEFMARQRALTPDLTPTSAAKPAPAPTPEDDTFARLQKLIGPSNSGFDPVAAQTAIRNTPVADYQAQQQIAASQAAGAGLAATAAEDAAVNRATARNVVGENFGGPPPIGEMFAKMLPASQGTLTAFPSGGFAVSRTPGEQFARQEVRRKNYAEARKGIPAVTAMTQNRYGNRYY